MLAANGHFFFRFWSKFLILLLQHRSTCFSHCEQSWWKQFYINMLHLLQTSAQNWPDRFPERLKMWFKTVPCLVDDIFSPQERERIQLWGRNTVGLPAIIFLYQPSNPSPAQTTTPTPRGTFLCRYVERATGEQSNFRRHKNGSLKKGRFCPVKF